MLQQSVQNRADGSSCLFESHVAATTEVNQDAPEEIVWLADKDKCDVVVYVKERPDSGPPCKKRIVDVKDVQVPWSNEDAKIIHRTFSNSSIVPSKEVAARLGLSKEKPISNLKDTLWDIYESCFYSEFDDSYPPAQLFRLIESLLQVPSRNSPNMWSRKAIKLLLEITDGKESVMSVASDEDLCESLLPALRAFTERTYVQRTESTTIWTTIRQFVKLLIEIFKRVATAKVILSASARTSLVKRWVPWLESIRLNERLCDADDMPVLKTYIKSIIDTLGMDDGELLSFLAHASMRNDYFLEGALKSWCFRLDQSLYQGLHVESCNLE